MEQRHQQVRAQQPCTTGGSVTPGLIFGLAIVAVGVLFLLGNFGFPVGMYWRYWPVALIAVGIAKIVDARDNSGRTWGAILIVAGVVLVGDQIHLPFFENVTLWQLWPLALIVFGGMMLWSALEGKPLSRRWTVNTCTLSQYAVFGGGKRKITGEFKGGDVFALFGGYEVDLRNASMEAEEAVIDANALFGGIEIRIPESWQAILQVTGIFGGHEDKTRQPDLRLVPNPKRLIIRGATMFGGMSVKN
jgi:predicted membrane protein